MLEVDAAKGGVDNRTSGIGHVLYAIKNGEKKVVRLHSAKLDERCSQWNPCELEALAFATALEKEQDIIRESKHPLIIMPDSKPVHQAVQLINQGKFSTSARMTSLLNNVNRFKIESKHISGKAKLNPLSDFQSRAPAECQTEVCAIHKFIQEKVNGDLDSTAKHGALQAEENIIASKESWKNAQKNNRACSVALKLLHAGKPPPKATGKTTGEYWNDVRKYCRDASISSDGMLVVKATPSIQSGNIEREK